MANVIAEISMSLDGYVAGPHATLEEPLGVGGEQLHDWVFPLEGWRRAHGLEGGEGGVESELLERSIRATGAVVMGRRMFSGGSGPWDEDPRAQGWWGDEPPFRKPVFVVTHHPRAPLQLGETTFTFVTDGVEAAVGSARSAAGEKDVSIAGGAHVIQQCLAAGLVDELHIHIAPLLLGGGVRLFGATTPARLEVTGVTEGPLATHVRYRVAH